MTVPASKIDLHVHTRYSATAGDFYLEKFGVQECYSTPEEVYNLAVKRGMDYVAITDHNTIEGALVLRDRSNVIVGEEVTAFFPEDQACVHVVVLDLNLRQHQEIQNLRTNLYDLVQFLQEQDLYHFIAHPFFRMTRLEIDHFEKMLLLFDHFEVKNGGKTLYPADLLEKVLSGLTAETLWRLAEKHDIFPVSKEPWKKSFVGGSDDHGGILVGETYTEVKKANSRQELILHLKAGATRAAGPGGSPLSVAESIRSVAVQFLYEKRKVFDCIGTKTGWTVVNRLFGPINNNGRLPLSVRTALFFFDHLFQKKFGRDPLKQRILHDMQQGRALRAMVERGRDCSEKSRRILFTTLEHLVIDLIQIGVRKKAWFSDAKMIAATIFTVLPYLIAYKTENKDRSLMRQVRKRFLDPKERDVIAVFSDTESSRLEDLSDVYPNSKIEYITPQTLRIHHPHHPLLSLSYREKTGQFPSVLTVLDRLHAMDCSRIYLETLRPIGLTGFVVAKWMDIPTDCRYPLSDFEYFMREMKDNKEVELLSWLFELYIKQVTCISSPVETAGRDRSAVLWDGPIESEMVVRCEDL
ncbi:PHP domain-containing protein [candidate division KSB1 bacterium]|nr:PHP domain-containing protein [candidate division KSB1 bacterium]